MWANRILRCRKAFAPSIYLLVSPFARSSASLSSRLPLNEHSLSESFFTPQWGYLMVRKLNNKSNSKFAFFGLNRNKGRKKKKSEKKINYHECELAFSATVCLWFSYAQLWTNSIKKSVILKFIRYWSRNLRFGFLFESFSFHTRNLKQTKQKKLINKTGNIH